MREKFFNFIFSINNSHAKSLQLFKDKPRRMDATHSFMGCVDRASVHGANSFMKIDLEKFKAERAARIAKDKEKLRAQDPLNVEKGLKELMKRTKIRPNGCQEWIGPLNKDGYGIVTYKGKAWNAHRLVYTLFWGEVDKNLNVCHKCDNRLCVRPSHLFLGSHQQNMQDAARKGRLFQQKPQFKKMVEARKLDTIRMQAKLLLAGLARFYNIPYDQVIQICKGQWKVQPEGDVPLVLKKRRGVRGY